MQHVQDHRNLNLHWDCSGRRVEVPEGSKSTKMYLQETLLKAEPVNKTQCTQHNIR
jgi:hypothetical protein